MENSWKAESSSFRDPNGFVFLHDGALYRQINKAGEREYRLLIDSGLYRELSGEGLLVAHDEVPLRLPGTAPAAAVIRPERIPFISYPYEWCFSQLKAAALLTLELQKRALHRKLVLRDASAYNVQFIGSQPVFIDTLSFGAREEGTPWPAYRQFCQHFLVPLTLWGFGLADLVLLNRIHIDGIPLSVAREVLPYRSWFRPGLLIHIHLHGRAQAVDGREVVGRPARQASMSSTAMLALTESLQKTVQRLSWNPPRTVWSSYTGDCSYTAAAQYEKRRIVRELIESAERGTELDTVWDLGANTGDYSRIAADLAQHVISFDLDPAVVEANFRACRERRDVRVLPLVQDLTSPSSAIGWHHRERKSLLQRGPADLALALALIHHLALGSNVPLPAIAAFLSESARCLIIEFVPKEDSQVRRMMALRQDVFPNYTQPAFEAAFGDRFQVSRSVPVADTGRTLYLMERR
jgi:hypothetical protein